jgi:hypothetical protein
MAVGWLDGKWLVEAVGGKQQRSTVANSVLGLVAEMTVAVLRKSPSRSNSLFQFFIFSGVPSPKTFFHFS